MSEDKRHEMPMDVLIGFLKLEAKSVLRGFSSEMFPDMRVEHALIIRKATDAQLLDMLRMMKQAAEDKRAKKD